MKEQQIIIKPFKLLNVLECTIIKKPNEHFSAHVIGHISYDLDETIIYSTSVNDIFSVDVLDENNNFLSLFRGVILDINISFEAGLKKIEIWAASRTVLMDQKEQVRIFQYEDQKYSDIVDFITSQNSNTISICTEGKQITNGMIVQYKETDWEFLKRIASQINTVLVADCVNNNAVFCFGVPRKSTRYTMNSVHYKIKRCINEFIVKKENKVSQFAEIDAVRYIVQSREVYDICTPINFLDLNLYILEIESRIVGNELLHTYTLGSSASFKTSRIYNEKIAGISLEGKIKEVKNDVVQIQLPQDVCKIYKWFPYSTVYSSPEGTGWYCMPEINDAIRLYFPDTLEDNAIVISSVHLNVKNNLRKNPDIKSIRSKHNKEVRFSPGSILLTNHNGMSVLLDDAKGIKLISDCDISLEADKDIDIVSGSKINILGDNGVIIQQGANKIEVHEGITEYGSSIIQK